MPAHLLSCLKTYNEWPFLPTYLTPKLQSPLQSRLSQWFSHSTSATYTHTTLWSPKLIRANLLLRHSLSTHTKYLHQRQPSLWTPTHTWRQLRSNMRALQALLNKGTSSLLPPLHIIHLLQHLSFHTIFISQCPVQGLAHYTNELV